MSDKMEWLDIRPDIGRPMLVNKDYVKAIRLDRDGVCVDIQDGSDFRISGANEEEANKMYKYLYKALGGEREWLDIRPDFTYPMLVNKDYVKGIRLRPDGVNVEIQDGSAPYISCANEEEANKMYMDFCKALGGEDVLLVKSKLNKKEMNRRT